MNWRRFMELLLGPAGRLITTFRAKRVVVQNSKFEPLTTGLGQNEKNSLRANVFRSCPNSRHRRAVPALPGCAKTGREQMQQDVLPEKEHPTYSMNSSARASSVGGTSMPSALAVFRLITSLNLTGA
jgi:hypothetical protein